MSKLSAFYTQNRAKSLIVLLLIVAAVLGEFLIFATPHKNSQNLRSSAATSCTINNFLINSCRPWIGTSAGKYAATGGLTQLQYAEKRFNNPNAVTNPTLAVTNTKQFDIMHLYNGVGSNTVNAEELGYAKRANTILLLNWKPTATWSKAGGGDAATNAGIKQMADSIKNTLGTTKIFFSVYHEPENDVSSGNCTTNAGNASAGSPTDYVNMWHNVRSIFNTEGVNNVVWVMNYMGFSGWNCLVPLLWPGNSYVDVVTFDKYGSGNEDFTTSTQPFYNLLTSTSDATHAYTSKPWGLSEFGYNSGTEANAMSFWSSATSAINSNHFPNLKLYVVFDSTGSGDSRVGYDINNNLSIPEQTAFNAFGYNILSMGASQPPPPPVDGTKPTISVTSPANGSTVNATITLNVSANDNVAVTRVTIYWDGTHLIRDSTAQGTYGWGSQWNTANAGNGSHTITATAYDAAGNSQATTDALVINNTSGVPAPTISSFTASPATVTVGQNSTLSWASANAINCSVNPGGPQNVTTTIWSTLAFSSTGSTTYTLTCKNSTNVTVSKTATVTVNPAPVPPTNVTLSADHTTIQTGGSVLLSWSSNGSSSCTMNPGSFTASGTTSSQPITNLRATTTYKVTCTNSAGSTDSNSVKVTVQAAPPPPANPSINSFTASPANIAYGATTDLAWQTSNVSSGGCSLAPTLETSLNGNSTWSSPPLTASISYTLTCRNSAGTTTSKSLSVIVANQPAPPPPPPSNPSNPAGNDNSNLTATGGQQVANGQSNGTVTQGSLLTLDSSNVTDSNKIKNIVRVEYYNGNTLVETVTKAPFALDTSLLKPGRYNLTQRTYYVDGSMSQQAQLITIKAKTTAQLKHGSNLVWIILVIIGLFIIGAAIIRWWFYRAGGGPKGPIVEQPVVISPNQIEQ